MKNSLNLIYCEGRKKPHMLRSAVLVLASVLALSFGSGAYALPINFVIDDVDVQITDVTGDCGFIGGISGACIPVVNTEAPISFTLNSLGDSEMIDLFDITIGGLGTGNGTASVETFLTFSAPSSESSDVITGSGSFLSEFTFAGFLGLGSFFEETVSVSYSTTPSIVSFDDGTEISLALNGGTDTCTGLLISGGCQVNVGVTASTTLTAVPEPGTLSLFGAGVLGFWIRRRRKV